MKGTSPTRSGFWPARHRSAKIEFASFNLITRGEVMDKLNGSQAGTVAAGIDMAKRTFAVCAVDVGQRVVLERTFNRGRLMEFFAKLPPCRIGLEACSGAHQLA